MSDTSEMRSHLVFSGLGDLLKHKIAIITLSNLTKEVKLKTTDAIF